MPRIVVSIDTLEFKHTDYTAAVKNHLEIQLRHAARAFIKAALPKIPVDTGMARGSFLNLGKALKVAVPIPRQSKKSKKYYYTPAKGQYKTPGLGSKLSSWSFLTESKDKLKFEFKSGVYHYNLLDFTGITNNAGHAQGPWGSFEAGNAAFLEVLAELTTRYRFPQIRDFMVKTRLTTTKSGGFTRHIVPIDSDYRETS